jgi:hypothetical protein
MKMKNHKNLSDEQVQQIMDSKMSSNEKSSIQLLNEDAELYGSIMDNLDLEPSISIPEDFAKNTFEIAERKKTFADISQKILLYSIVSVPLIIASLVVVYTIGNDLFWQIMGTISNNINYVVFSIVLISLIQLLDHKLIKSKFKEVQ